MNYLSFLATDFTISIIVCFGIIPSTIHGQSNQIFSVGEAHITDQAIELHKKLFIITGTQTARCGRGIFPKSTRKGIWTSLECNRQILLFRCSLQSQELQGGQNFKLWKQTIIWIAVWGAWGLGWKRFLCKKWTFKTVKLQGLQETFQDNEEMFGKSFYLKGLFQGLQHDYNESGRNNSSNC